MLAHLLEHWFITAVAAACLLLVAYALWARATDARFGIRRTGGRGGSLFVSFPTHVARVEFEIGGTVDLIVYAESLRDGEGHPLSAERQSEVLARLRAWAAARRLSLEVPGRFSTHAPVA